MELKKTVAYASQTLTTTKCQTISHLLILYGRQFTLITDHKPLSTILNPRQTLPTLAAAKMQRWALLLTAYQYDIEFHSISHLPLPEFPLLIESLFNVQQITSSRQF